MATSSRSTIIKAARNLTVFPGSYITRPATKLPVPQHLEPLPLPQNFPYSVPLLFKCCHYSKFIQTCRNYSQESTSQEKRSDNTRAIAETRENPYSHLTLGGKVKQASKDAYYTGIVIAGIGVTGLMFYAIFRELFSKSSPNRIYGEALDLCRQHTRVIDNLGEPIKGYGELSSRGRRRHISHLEYLQDGVNHMRMKFYIEGSRRKGTVHLEVVQNEKGRYEFRYLFVDLEDYYPRDTIIIQDNRLKHDAKEPLPLFE